MVVVQVSELRLVGGILATLSDVSVILAPLGAEPLPFIPCLFHSVVPVACTEHLTQVFHHFTLVSGAYIAHDIEFQMGGASLRLRALEHLADNVFQALDV